MVKRLALLAVSLLLLLSACEAIYPIAPTPLPQAIPQATLAAGQVQMMELAARSTQVALELTLAAATDTAYTRATQAAQDWQSTSTMQAVAIQATADSRHALTQAAQITATAQTQATQTAWPMTATPMAATQMVIEMEATRLQRQAVWEQYIIPFQIIVPTILLIAAVILLFALFISAYHRFAPVVETRLRTVFHGEEVITMLPENQRMNFIQPGRNFGAGLHAGPDGIHVDGIAPDHQLQDRTTARHQAAVLAHALPPQRSTAVRRLMAPPAEMPHQPQTQPVRIEIVPPDQVRPWVDEVRQQMLLTTGEEMEDLK